MRWRDLFDDLEATVRADARRELDAEVADRVRRERALIGLYERLAAARGRPVVLHCAGAGLLRGRVDDLGDGWVVLVGDRGGQALVALAAVRAVDGLGPGADLTAAPGRRFGLGFALRALSRDRAAVRVVDVDGAVREGHLVAVGSDVVDLREHPVDVPGRAREGRVVVVAQAALAALLTGPW